MGNIEPIKRRSEAGRIGGLTTAARYGAGYMRMIGTAGAARGGRPRRRTLEEIMRGASGANPALDQKRGGDIVPFHTNRSADVPAPALQGLHTNDERNL